jgi:hypothetical protein
LHNQKNITEIQNKGATFLLAQKSVGWSFNYLARSPGENISSPYPDDLDDTFLALAAITHHDPQKINGQALAAITRLLLMLEAHQGGPFKTWLVPKDSSESWHDIDIVVNSNIGYFLSIIDIHLPAVEKFIAQTIKEHRLLSPYYPGFYPAIYFLSRFYKNQDLAEILTADLAANAKQINMLERAMAISSLINLGRSSTMIGQKILAPFIAQIKSEGFKPYAFCIDPRRDNKRSYAGSSALTAALCVEALYGYYSSQNSSSTKWPITAHAHIQNLAREQCQKDALELHALAMQQIERTSDERITGIAYEVQKILTINDQIISDALTENLALANLYGWMAYTIYDDVIDGEGNAALIPCANFFLRKLIDMYSYLDKELPGTQVIFNITIDSIDTASAWEQKYSTIHMPIENILTQELPPFDDYSNLANRSIGHALPPLIGLLSIGYDMHSEEYTKTQDLFRHYFIARQLHDDAHDWEEDLLHGKINSVCALLLKNFQKKYCEHSKLVHLNDALPELRRIFWEEIIDEATNLILFHIACAQTAKEKSTVFGKTDFMEGPLQNLRLSAQKALKERQTTIEFLKYYRTSS